MNENILWIKKLPKSSDYLVAAYKNSLFLALVSLDETQPISAIETVTMKKKIILDKNYAHQSFYKGVYLAKTGGVKAISIALKKCKESICFENNEEINLCLEERVAESHKQLYFKSFL